MKQKPCELGMFIVAGLQDKKINQTALAEKCNVTKAHISHIISGRTKPSFLTLIKITRVLDIDLTDAIRAFVGEEIWAAIG